MDYSFHNHTYLCHHATGTIEEYVVNAINNSIKYMGFSEHFPLKYKDLPQTEHRLLVEQIDKYFDEVKRCKEKYKDKIDILIGFEMEYYSDIFDQMYKDAVGYGADYLICGQHYTQCEYKYDTLQVSKPSSDINHLKKYVSSVCEAIYKKVFTYIAHPDVLNFTGDKEIFKKEFSKICKASCETNTPLEINFLGIRQGRNYPNPDIWSLIGEYKCPVTFGFDAHSVIDSFDGKSLEIAHMYVDKYSLNYIGRPDIINIQKKG